LSTRRRDRSPRARGTTDAAARCNNQRRWTMRAIMLASLLVLYGCSDPDREQDILDAIEEAGMVVPLGPNSDVVTASETKVEGDYEKIYEQHDALANLENVAYFGLNDDLVWPGALVKGTHAHDFVFEPIAIPRGPITMSVSLEGSGSTGPLSIVVDDPKLSTVRDGISQLLAGAMTPGTHVPARVDYREQQVSNQSHMSLFVGADVSYGAGSLATRFDWNSTTRRNKVMVKYTQIYYTVDLDTPESPVALVADSVTGEDVAAAMPPGSMPLYVASVGYGMMAVMFIETNFTEEEMKLALNAAYAGAFDADVAIGYTAKDVLEESNITIIVYGGGTKGLGDIETGYEGFQKVIAASQNYGPETPGVPIVYKFRHVRDNTLGLVSLTSQYTLVRPVQIRQRLAVRVEAFTCEMSDDEGAGNNVDIDRMTAWVTAYEGTPPNPIPPGTIEIYRYAGAEIVMGVGHRHVVGQEVAVAFDTRSYPLDDAVLALQAYARDYDPLSANEEDNRILWLSGRQFFENGGRHAVYLYSADFRFKVDFTLRDLSRQ
jgi:hypothetical protein